MLNEIDDRAEAQWTMVSSLTAVAAERRAAQHGRGAAGIVTLHRSVVMRLRRLRSLASPVRTTPNGEAPCTPS